MGQENSMSLTSVSQLQVKSLVGALLPVGQLNADVELRWALDQ